MWEPGLLALFREKQVMGRPQDCRACTLEGRRGKGEGRVGSKVARWGSGREGGARSPPGLRWLPTVAHQDP